MSKKYILVGVVVIIVLPVVALAWWLLSPLLVDQTVEEELPFAAQAVVPADMTRAEVEDVMAGMAKLTRPVDEPMPDQMMMIAQDSSGSSPTATAPAMPANRPIPDKKTIDVEDSSGVSPTTTASGGSGTALVLSAGTFQDADRFHQGSGEATIYRGPDGSYLLRLVSMAGMAKLTRPVDEPMPDQMMMIAQDSSGSSPTATAPAMPANRPIPDKKTIDVEDSSGVSPTTTASGGSGTALVLSAGTFQDADRFHQGSGEATIYRGPDGSYLLRLENFQVTNGPDLHVILSPSPAPESREDVHQPGYLDLGSLKGNRGNQNYEIPADVDVDAWSSVVIYCSPFHVVFSVALLKTAG